MFVKQVGRNPVSRRGWGRSLVTTINTTDNNFPVTFVFDAYKDVKASFSLKKEFLDNFDIYWKGRGNSLQIGMEKRRDLAKRYKLFKFVLLIELNNFLEGNNFLPLFCKSVFN